MATISSILQNNWRLSRRLLMKQKNKTEIPEKKL